MIKKLRPDLIQRNKLKISISYCPERIIPGNTLYELINNDRIIGGINYESAIKAKKLYSLFVTN